MDITEATIALAALGQSTRLSIFRLLVEAGAEGRRVGEIVDTLSLPGATLSFHLKELSIAGLIEGEQRGRFICYRARFETMNALIAFLVKDCCGVDSDASCLPVLKAATKTSRRRAGG